MPKQVYWVLEVKLNDGKQEDFRTLMQEMVAATEANEPGTLNYEWSISEDRSTCHIYERYADSAATMVHLGTFGEKFAGRFLDCVAPSRFTVYGNPNDEVKGALAGFGPAYMTDFGGFAR